MEYLVGVTLSLSVAVLAALVGLDREQAFYPTVLIRDRFILRIVCRDGSFEADTRY